MTVRTFKYLAIFMFFTLNLINKSVYSQQYRYSIDIKEKKNRRVPFKFWISETKSELRSTWEWRKNKRIEEKTSKKIRKHTYKIQKGYVQKRMKQNKKEAEWYNQNKLPFLVKLKKQRNGKPI